jgi:hypothetical protein
MTKGCHNYHFEDNIRYCYFIAHIASLSFSQNIDDCIVYAFGFPTLLSYFCVFVWYFDNYYLVKYFFCLDIYINNMFF